jgi:hypothetical protein
MTSAYSILEAKEAKVQKRAIEKHVAPLSDMEQEELDAVNKRLAWEKETILQKIGKSVEHFDEEVEALRKEKFKAEGDLKVLDLKMIVLHKELELLKEFEKEDIQLAEKLQAKRSEKAEFTSKIDEFQIKLKSKTKEMEAVNDNIQSLERQFMLIIADKPGITDALRKIYSKNVKRSRKVSFRGSFLTRLEARKRSRRFQLQRRRRSCR